ncbi:MAG: hypothetical protein JXA21_09950 [Anaerolineae bacterium]|nr:hypothetical protein [Anaerolineae bacterium]
MLRRYLLHDNIFIRFAALWGSVMTLFLAAWTLSYLFLPEGLLQGRNLAQTLAGETLTGGSVWLEWLRLLAINLAVMLGVVVAPNVLRTARDYPLGYSTVTLLTLLFAVTLGANSFTLSVGGKQPSTLAIFTSSGLYEVTAYLLAAAATCSLAKYRLVGQWPKQTVEAVVIPPTKPLIIVLAADLLTTPLWVIGGVALWRRPLGYVVGTDRSFRPACCSWRRWSFSSGKETWR